MLLWLEKVLAQVYYIWWRLFEGDKTNVDEQIKIFWEKQKLCVFVDCPMYKLLCKIYGTMDLLQINAPVSYFSISAVEDGVEVTFNWTTKCFD